MSKHAVFSLIVAFVLFPLVILAQCAQNTTYTLNPPPVDGQYESGQTVQICGSFTYTQSGAIWVHGIVPLIPEGWDMGSLIVTPPASCSGSGVWGWYTSVTGTAGSAGTYGPGIFYDQGGDGNPGNNFGDNCLTGSFSFCITLTVADCGGALTDGADLTIDFMILGDNSSGSWNNFSCGQDIIAGTNVTLSCCAGEEISVSICNDGPNQNLFDLFTDSPGGGTWQNPGGGAFNGTFIPGTSADGVYTYAFDDGDCAAESTVEVTTIPAPDAGNGQNITVCEGADAFDLNNQIVGGDPGGTWTDPTNAETNGTFTPGTSTPGVYTYTVGDGLLCPQSQTVVVVTVNPNPFAGDNGSITACESDPQLNLFNFLLNDPEAGGNWTDPSGNAHNGLFTPGASEAGIYTYTVGDPPCSSSATVTVTIIDLPYAGEDAELSVCPDDAPVDLFSLLPGADAGGFWANPNNAGFGGTFTPGSDMDGVYTYQIGGAACNDVANVTVTTLDAPDGTIAADNTYCEGSEIEITFTLNGNGPFDVTYSVNGNQSTLNDINSGHIQTLSPNGDVTIELVSVTDNSGAGCTGEGNTINITMIPTPSATLVGGGGLCAGEEGTITFELTGQGPFNVVYTDGTDNFSLNGINNGHTINVSPQNNTTYTLVSVEDNSASSCEGVINGSAVFNVNEPPSGTISGNADVCAGESTDLTFTLTGDGPFDVVYSNGAENFTLLGINNGHTVSVTPQFLSFYQLVSVVSQGNPDCPGETNGFVQITVSVPPTYNSLLHTCNDVSEGYVVTFNIAGGNPNSYVVNGDNGTISGNSFTSDEIPSGEAYTFLLDDGNGCGPVEIIGDHTCDCITEVGTMVVQDLEVCSSETAIFIHNGNEVLDPNDGLVFLLTDEPLYSTSTIFIENDVPEFEFQDELELNTTYYIYAVAGNVGGSGNISIDIADPCWSSTPGGTVTFIESPTATLSGTGAICPGEITELTIELTGSAPWEVEYAIDGVSAGSFTSNNTNYSLEVSEGGTYTLLSVVDNMCSGTTDGSVDVSEYDIPTAEISGGGNICAGSGEGPQVALTGNGPWTITYTINGGNATTVQINNSPYTIAAEISGNYIITQVSDANCSGDGIGNANVNIVNPPVVTVSGGGQVCAGDSGEIQFTGAGNGTITANYAVDGVPSGSIDLTDGEASLTTSQGGVYTITSATDAFCTGSGDGSTATLIVNPIPTADIQLNPQAICEGDSALLSIAMTGNGPFNLVYSNGDDLIIEENTGNIHQYIFPENGQEFSLISVEDNSNPTCSQNLSASVTAQVLAAPDAPQLSDLFRCNADTFPQIGVEPISGLNYHWVPENGLTNPNIANPVLNLQNNTSEEQTYTYNLVVGNGICSVQSSMEVTINPGPQVAFTYSPKPVTTEATTVNFFNQTPGFNDYEWEFADLGSSTNTNTVFTFPDGIEGKYPVTLTATDPQTGCVNSITQVIEVKGALLVYVPNAFTPNGDGINDLFGPVVRNHRAELYEFMIFNRQGEMVFSSQSPDIKWNGGEPSATHFAADGVYVWILKVADIYSTEVKEFKGSVTVLR